MPISVDLSVVMGRAGLFGEGTIEPSLDGAKSAL
jgi:hypothetical protein